MIDFNRPAFTGREFDYIRDAVQRGMLCGDGEYTKRCSQWMMDKFHVNHVMLTTSCTHALEMAAHLCDIKPGDEVIMPSYTFVSTADAFVLKGAKIVFVERNIFFRCFTDTSETERKYQIRKPNQGISQFPGDSLIHHIYADPPPQYMVLYKSRYALWSCH